MKKIIIALLMLIGITAYLYADSAREVNEGDVVFQISKSQQSPLIAYATGSPWTHCGIVVYKGKVPYVLEASGHVKLTKWSDWKAKGMGGIVEIRKAPEPRKIKYSQYLGKPYDLAFRFNNGKWYCSELVYDIYMKQYGISLCKPRPVSDYDTTGAEDVMRLRGIYMSQLVVAPSDILDSPYMK